MKISVLHAGAIALAGLAGAGVAEAATVFVNGDEWALSNAGFFNAPDGAVEQFVANLVGEFGQTIHAYSTSFAYTQGDLASAMARAGATFTAGTGFDFTLPNLTAFDAIMLGGDFLTAEELAVLGDYVAAGGSVYISTGSGGAGSSSAEAEAWNGFLSAYGIELDTSFTGFFGTVTTTGDPLFAGVEKLYVGNPNGVIQGAICCSENSVFGIWRSDDAMGGGLPAKQ